MNKFISFFTRLTTLTEKLCNLPQLKFALFYLQILSNHFINIFHLFHLEKLGKIVIEIEN